MKRTIDAVLIAAVAVVTITGTVSVLNGSTKHNPLDHWVVAKWGQLRHAQAAPSLAVSTPTSSHGAQPSTPRDNVSPHPKTAVAQPSPSAHHAAPPSAQMQQNGTTGSGHWTQADVIKLEAIGTHLVYALGPEDWQQIAQALSTGEPTSAADQTLAQILRGRLPSSDRQWLVEHFTGAHAVNQQDVQLLQRSVSQAESELTPAERKLLENELNALEGKRAGTASAQTADGGGEKSGTSTLHGTSEATARK